jgi:hypothetical protein
MKKAIVVFFSIVFIQALIMLLIIDKVGFETMIYTLKEYIVYFQVTYILLLFGSFVVYMINMPEDRSTGLGLIFAVLVGLILLLVVKMVIV